MLELPASSPSTGFDLLDGIRVLDLTSSIAGPYGTMLLGDLGADVLKVERPGVGDDARSWGPPFLDGESLWFLSVNRNKRSIVLDHATEDGRETLHRLVAGCDILITTLRPTSLARLGLDYESAVRLCPGLIHCSLTGYGSSGPSRDWPSYDLIAEGASGIMDLTGEADGPPQKVGSPAADLLAGMDAAFAIVAALVDRERTGRGHRIDVSLIESMTRFLTPKLVSYLGSGDLQRRSGGRDSVIAVYQVFETADLPVTIAVGNDAIFQRFCRAIGREELLVEPGYADNAGRRARREELISSIQRTISTRPRSHWLEVLRAADVPVGPINHIEDVVEDPHLLARSLFYRIPEGSGIPQVNTGWHLDGRPNGYRRSPPRLGAHEPEWPPRVDVPDRCSD